MAKICNDLVVTNCLECSCQNYMSLCETFICLHEDVQKKGSGLLVLCEKSGQPYIHTPRWCPLKDV